jgi:Mitochondrial carrier protein
MPTTLSYIQTLYGITVVKISATLLVFFGCSNDHERYQSLKTFTSTDCSTLCSYHGKRARCSSSSTLTSSLSLRIQIQRNLVIVSLLLISLYLQSKAVTVSSISSLSSSRNRLNSVSTVILQKKKSRAWVNGLKNGLCSAGASACSKTLLQPIDAIKTMQQYYQQQSTTATATAVVGSHSHHTRTTALSLWGACKEIMNRPGSTKGGFGNFYSGLSINVIGAIPSVALYFGVYSYCKQRLLETKFGQQSPIVCIATSAAIGNTVASFSRVPYEVLKQQLQTGLYTSTYDALKAVITTKGMFWTMIFPKGGIAIQMIRDVPYAVVTLLVYESLQTKFNTNNKQQQSTTTTKGLVPAQKTTTRKTTSSTMKTVNNKNNKIIDFLVGGIAGGIGSYVTNPMDVIKTRLQTNSIQYNGSIILCIQEIYNENGLSTFLRGSIPRLIHKVPANAFFFFFYELFRKILNVE